MQGLHIPIAQITLVTIFLDKICALLLLPQSQTACLPDKERTNRPPLKLAAAYKLMWSLLTVAISVSHSVVSRIDITGVDNL